MDSPLTHGSLFAGIGGFEMVARECGGKTLWNCEIDPYCRLVLNARFPGTAQYGDITKLRGTDLPPVSVITFGSPCQSFSVASSTRAGLDGASGLFFEAIRLIREMRAATGGQAPRWAIMENVPGIFSASSSRGADKSDFGVVLNEFAKLCGEAVDVPEPPKGKWLRAGAILGDHYSIAWRVLCASQFGLAQRRQRMFLVVSFDDGRAAQILSEQEGERRDFTPGYRKGQSPAGDPAAGFGSVGFEPGLLARKGGHAWAELTGCLRADCGDNQAAVAVKTAVYGIGSMSSEGMLSDDPTSGIYEADTARTLDTGGGNPACNQGGVIITEGREAVFYQDKIGCLLASDYKWPQAQQITSDKAVVEREGARYTARRLMPKECLLLQGLPADHLDNIHIAAPTEADVDYWYGVWEEHRAALGKSARPKSRSQIVKWLRNPYSDAQAYRAIGNSLAVPCAQFVFKGITRAETSNKT